MDTSTHTTPTTSEKHESPVPSLQDVEKLDSTVVANDKVEYATGLRLFLIMLTILMSTSLAAIEIGIIATAIPGITDTFHRLNDVGWYGSVTFLMGCAAPMWGKIFKYLNIKYAYLTSVAIYLVASVIAGTAQKSAAVIVGRALQGLGACGTLGGSLLVINYVARPDKRPFLIGMWMAIFMISTIIGPLIGGAFTSNVRQVSLSRPIPMTSSADCGKLALVLLHKFATWRTHRRFGPALPQDSQAYPIHTCHLDRNYCTTRYTGILHVSCVPCMSDLGATVRRPD
jgi:hypothetical protein